MFVFSCANLVNGVESSMGISVYKLDKFEPQILSDSAHKWSSFKINLSRQFLIRFSTPSESEGSRFVGFVSVSAITRILPFPCVSTTGCVFVFFPSTLSTLFSLSSELWFFECSFSAAKLVTFLPVKISQWCSMSSSTISDLCSRSPTVSPHSVFGKERARALVV